MRTSLTIVAAAILTVLSSARVRAQERGDVGITMGYPMPDIATSPTGHAFALRSSGGVIFYF